MQLRGLMDFARATRWADKDHKFELLRLIHATLEPHLRGDWQTQNDVSRRTVHLYVQVRHQIYVHFEFALHGGWADAKVATAGTNLKWFASKWFVARLDTNGADFLGWLSLIREVLDELEAMGGPNRFILPDTPEFWDEAQRKRGWV